MRVNPPEVLLNRLGRRAQWPDGPVPVPGRRVLVACSGGADSLALLALAVHAGLDVVAGHVDHGLRADASEDTRVVQSAAAQLGVTAVSGSVSIPPGSNLEARARTARYAALRELADANHCAVILTGHTLDDQAETVLLATLRGSGLDGLSGIPVRRGVIARPLLGVRRHETRELCRAFGWAPVIDPMNYDHRFIRVWLRREVLPRLEVGADRDLAVVLARQAELLRADSEVLDTLAVELLAGCESGLRVETLLGAPIAIARRALRRWLPVAAGSQAIESILAVAGGEGRAVDIGSGHRVRRSAGLLIVEPISATAAGHASVALRVPGSAQFGEFVVSARVETAAPAGWPDGREVCVLDADVLGARAVLRSAESGERFRPIGSSGTKTVASALADARVGIDERRQLPVLARPDGEIVWVLGYRGAHGARVTSSTRRYCWMSVDRVSR